MYRCSVQQSEYVNGKLVSAQIRFQCQFLNLFFLLYIHAISHHGDTSSPAQFLVGCVHWLFPDFTFQWLVEEIRTNLPMELDFCHEARNQERFAAMFSGVGFVKAPSVNWEFTTPRVLTMEFCEGGKVNDVEYMRRNGLSGADVSV